MTRRIRLGARSSPLSRWQAEFVRSRLSHYYPDLQIEIVWIQTTGDAFQDRALKDIGGKGLFLKEIEEAMLDGRVDLGVHSLKDVPEPLPSGFVLAAYLEREDPRDVLVGPYPSLEAIPQGSRLGTASPRRHAYLSSWRPDCTILPIRGNVGSRLEKMKRGECDGLVLAAAGLHRLGLSSELRCYLPMVPAVGQGILTLEALASNAELIDLVRVLNDPISEFAAKAERSFMLAMEGSCHTALGCYVRPASDSRWIAECFYQARTLELWHQKHESSQDELGAFLLDTAKAWKQR